MATCFEVMHLEDTICVRSRDFKKQGSLRYYILSAFLHMFHALHSLWVTLLPFALLWWNVMLHATCAKYYSWNRSLLLLQTMGRRFCSNITCTSCTFYDASIAEGPLSPQQRGSIADSSSAENREISIFSFLGQATCGCAAKSDVGSLPLEHRKLCCPSRGFGVSIQSFPHRNGLHMLDHCGDVTATCPKNSGSQFEERIPCATASLVSEAQLVATLSSTSKHSSLCLLEKREPQPSAPLKGSVLSSFLAHQVLPLAVLDVHVCPHSSLEHLCLQVYLHRNGNMLELKVPVLMDHIPANWPMLREQLQMVNGDGVLTLSSGKNLAWNSSKPLASQTRYDNYAILQLILSTTEGFNIFDAVPSQDLAEILRLRTRVQLSFLDSSSFNMTRDISYVDNEQSGSGRSSEDRGSLCCTSIKSANGCDGTYCIDDESSHDRDDRFGDSGFVYSKQCYQDDGYCYKCYEGYEDSGADDAEDVNGSLDHPAMDNSFYDCSADCNVKYNGLHSVTDVDGFCSMDYDVSHGEYEDFEGDVEGSDLVCGDFQFVYEEGVSENPFEIRRIHVAKSNTWWDDDAVLVAKQENEEGSIDEEWLVV